MQQFIINLFVWAITMLTNNHEKVPNPLSSTAIQKNFIKVSETLFINKFEVSNAEYNKFLEHLKANGQNDLYLQLKLDTTQWEQFEAKAYSKYYHTHQSFENYPVANVSFEAANAYCNWITTQYMQDSKRPYKKVVFRLPAEAEWLMAAQNESPDQAYPWGNMAWLDKDGLPRCNYYRIHDAELHYNEAKAAYEIIGPRSSAEYQTPVNAFRPTGKGFYNLAGNVAEMISTEGIAKGGSFNDPGYDVGNTVKKSYSKPSPTIGFRVLMEVIEN